MSALAPEGFALTPRCPLCGGDSRTRGPVRLRGNQVAEGRVCDACGARWAIDDDGHEVGRVEGGGL
jgi:hypothetical protein